MATQWMITDLSVYTVREDGSRSYSYQMAEAQLETFTFSLPDAATTTATGATVQARRLDTSELVPDLASVVGAPVDKTVTILIDGPTGGLVRGRNYEILVVLAESDGDSEPATLVIECVA